MKDLLYWALRTLDLNVTFNFTHRKQCVSTYFTHTMEKSTIIWKERRATTLNFEKNIMFEYHLLQDRTDLLFLQATAKLTPCSAQTSICWSCHFILLTAQVTYLWEAMIADLRRLRNRFPTLISRWYWNFESLHRNIMLC